MLLLALWSKTWNMVRGVMATQSLETSLLTRLAHPIQIEFELICLAVVWRRSSFLSCVRSQDVLPN
jgi:hypothetical protein